ncbi:MAG: replication-associated recombination protein A [Actinobacteria bacterium]|nr:replication-associated recombination protein A [Actinomycetota bacterium]
MNLFEDKQSSLTPEEKTNNYASPPLAERMRPQNLDSFVGQEHLVGSGKVLRQLIEQDSLPSIIFWGPPGSGKTTLARIIAQRTKSRFISYSAVISGIKQIKDVMEVAVYEQKKSNKKTILFIDEIHRFNKAQQDAFLPYVENGTIILIGATTENPSFEVISALLSRCKVFILNKLEPGEIVILLKRALYDKSKGYGEYEIKIEEDAIAFISNCCDGDSRIAYNILELAVNSTMQANEPAAAMGQKYKKSAINRIEKNTHTGGKLLKKSKNKNSAVINIALIENIIQKKALLYDKNGEEHFNIISALHKSMRGSDPDASAYWAARMIESGEDPLYILRRMARFASEDIGLADPHAMSIVIAAKNTFEFIGPPEGNLAILEAAIYLSLAPKSNALYKTLNLVQQDIEKYQSLPVPYHIRNAPTKLMKDTGYSKGYKYPHDFRNAIVSQQFMPDKLSGKKYYNPTGRGFEKELKSRIEKISNLKNEIEKNK